MKKTITLQPGISGTLPFTLSPTQPNQYTVSLEGFSRNFTAIVQLANLYGTVRDSVGNRIQNALVELNTDSVYTDQWGEFEFINKQTGSYTLVVSKSGYQTRTLPVNLVSGDNHAGNIILNIYEADFQVSNLIVDKDEVFVGESVTIGVDVENTGDVAGSCTIGTDPTSDFVIVITPGTWSPAMVPTVYRPAVDIEPIISLMMVIVMMTMITRMVK